MTAAGTTPLSAPHAGPVIEGELQCAGFVSRSAAAIIDVFVFAAISAGTLFFLQAATALVHTEPFGSVSVSSALAGTTIAVLVVVYFAGAWAITGRTVGEAMLGLRVVRPDGSRVKLLRSLARCAITFLSLPFLGLGFLWILVDRQRRTWQDIGARTIVVYSFGRPERPVPMPRR